MQLLVPPAGTDRQSSSCAYLRPGEICAMSLAVQGPRDQAILRCEAYVSMDVREKLLFHDKLFMVMPKNSAAPISIPMPGISEGAGMPSFCGFLRQSVPPLPIHKGLWYRFPAGNLGRARSFRPEITLILTI